jgi:hypothetical protein
MPVGIGNVDLSAVERMLTDFQCDAELHSAMASVHYTQSLYILRLPKNKKHSFLFVW